MDNFLDVIIVRKNKGLYNLIYLFMSAVMVMIGFMALLALLSISTPDINSNTDALNFNSLLEFIVFGGLTAVVYFFRGSLKVDYDIAITNGFVEVAKVLNNTKRKELIKFDIKEAEVGGMTDSSEFDKFLNIKNLKKVYAVLNKDSKKYFIKTRINDNSYLFIFEYNKELVEIMSQYNPRNIKMEIL